MVKKVSLFDYSDQPTGNDSLEIVRLGYNETALIPFTDEGEDVNVHYCAEADINGYVQCNGPDCIQCKIGRKIDFRILIPVFMPLSGRVAVLPVSKSLRPYALLPQLNNALKRKMPVGVFVRREGTKYILSYFELSEDADCGEVQIKQFLEDYESEKISLASAYPKMSDEELAKVDGIAQMLKLKGITK